MKIEYFVARKVAASGGRSFTRLILWIAVVAVALSLTIMIATTALISGFKSEITEKIFGFWGHIHLTDAKINRSFLDARPVKANPALIAALDSIGGVTYTEPPAFLGRVWENWAFERSTMGGIRQVQGFAMIPGIIQTREQIEGIILKGVGPDFDWGFMKGYLQEGTIPDVSGAEAEEAIVLSRQTADRLDVSVGDKFLIHFVKEGDVVRRRFDVSGIYKTGLEEYDQKFALVDIRRVRQLLGWGPDEVAGWEIFLDDISDLDIITEYLYYEVIPNNLYVESIREKFPAIFEWLDLQDINEVVILVLMLVVAIINMMTALLILILERTNMIGILKALGLENWSIRKIFLYYAAFIVAAGLLIGNVFGLGICLMQKHFGFIRLSEADYYLAVAPIQIDPVQIFLLNAGTMLLTLIFLIIPTYLVTRISPVQAIRFK